MPKWDKIEVIVVKLMIRLYILWLIICKDSEYLTKYGLTIFYEFKTQKFNIRIIIFNQNFWISISVRVNSVILMPN